MVIDQSGRIEETQRVTIIALADKRKSYTIAIPAKVKRDLQEIFRKRGRPKTFPIVVFATSVFLVMLKSRNFLQTLIIDIEYPGHENTIKNIIITLCRRFKKKVPEIYFAKIGKKDPAHLAAWKTFNKKLKPDLIITLTDFKGFIRRKK